MLVCSCRKDHGQFTGYGISRGNSIGKIRPEPHDGVRIVGRLSRGDVASIQAETTSPSRPAKLDPAAHPFADSTPANGATRKTGEDFGYGRRVQTFRKQPVGTERWNHVRRRLCGTREKSNNVRAYTLCQGRAPCGPTWASHAVTCWPDSRSRRDRGTYGAAGRGWLGWGTHYPPACAWGLLCARGRSRAVAFTCAFPIQAPRREPGDDVGGFNRGRAFSGWRTHYPPACAWGLLCAGAFMRTGFYACEPGYSTLIFGAFGLSSLPPLSSDLESGASTGGKPLSRRQIS